MSFYPLSFYPMRSLLLAAPLALLPVAMTACGSSTAAPAPPPQPPGCRLSIAGTPRAGGPVEVLMTLVNGGSETLFLLGWRTPFEPGWMGSPFRLVGPDGAEIPFQGATVKRGDPQIGEYAGIPASSERSASADLAQAYDVGKPGRYRLELSEPLLDATTQGGTLPRRRDQHVPLTVSCPPLEFELPPG